MGELQRKSRWMNRRHTIIYLTTLFVLILPMIVAAVVVRDERVLNWVVRNELTYWLFGGFLLYKWSYMAFIPFFAWYLQKQQQLSQPP